MSTSVGNSERDNETVYINSVIFKKDTYCCKTGEFTGRHRGLLMYKKDKNGKKKYMLVENFFKYHKPIIQIPAEIGDSIN